MSAAPEINPAIAPLIELLSNRRRHMITVGGNVFDDVMVSPELPVVNGAIELLRQLTEDAYPNFVTYDPFHGVRTSRGKGPTDAKAPAPGANANPLMQALQAANGSGERVTDPVKAFRLIDEMLGEDKRQPTVVVIAYADPILNVEETGPASPALAQLRVALLEWARDERIHEAGHLIALVDREAHVMSGSCLDPSGCVEVFRLGAPAQDVRLALAMSDDCGLRAEEANDVARVSAGLSLAELARLIKEAPKRRAFEAVLAAKRKLLNDRYGDLLEVIEPRCGFEGIGGLDHIKARFREIVKAMRDGETSLVPMGVLMMGPPGTGKTITAEALAKEAGVNMFRFKDIKSMFVGQSERRMTRALDAARDLAPAIPFMDEIDQSMAGGSRGSFDGDSGVSSGLRKKLLEVMSDASLRGKLLWLAATNMPDLLDPALKRIGRFDLRLFFPPAESDELAEICKAAFVQYPGMKTTVRDWKEHAEVAYARGLTGAEMIEVVRKAWARAVKKGQSALQKDDVSWALDDLITQDADVHRIAQMTYAALMSVSSKELLPSKWREIRNNLIPQKRDEKQLDDMLVAVSRATNPVPS